MGDFSRDTFDQLKHYVSVRLQQGVPLVDADWNEQDDIRKHELQAFLKWFVGNGVPKDNDGFHILAIPEGEADNDFVIKGGDGDPETAGRCLVEGWDILNASDIRYTEQPLFVDEQLAVEWGVDSLLPLQPPDTGERTDLVYVDVWEREIDAIEDEDLVNPVIGVETCVRIKREWVVRVAEDTETVPEDPPEGHVFLALALLARRAGESVIGAEDMTDLRLTGLSLVSHYDVQQIVQDAYGEDYTLDHDGQPNLKASLRDAINAILRGGLPGTPEQSRPPRTNVVSQPFALGDRNGDVWLFWQSNRSGGTRHIWYNRYHRDRNDWEEDDTRVSTAASDHESEPFALEDSNGDIWVFWRASQDDNVDIRYRRYRRDLDDWEEADVQLTSDAGTNERPMALEDHTGVIWVFWQSDRRGSFDIWYNRYNPASEQWEENDSFVTQDSDTDIRPFALEDRNGEIWVFWHSDRDGTFGVWYNRHKPDSDTWETNDTRLTNDSDRNDPPMAVERPNGEIWAFWQTDRDDNANIYYARHNDFDGGSWTQAEELTTDPGQDTEPFVLKDHNGELWLLWKSNRNGDRAIWYKRHTEDTGWGHARQLTTPDVGLGDQMPMAFEDVTGEIWAFWRRIGIDVINIQYKTLIPAI